MRPIQVSVDLRSSPGVVWNDVKNIASHTEWMRDAVAIRFTSATTSGVGTTFDCDTQVGRFRLTDRMQVTEWTEGRAIAIRHVGLITGEGRFTIEPDGTGTRFVWTESLQFPWSRGGPLGAALARPVLRRVWRENLERLRDRIDGGGAVSAR